VREKIVAGNWKMNTTPVEGAELVRKLSDRIGLLDRVKVVVCPPATHLTIITDLLRGSKLEVGAQNVHWEASGAFTGEISTDMLLSIGVKWAIIGHSERRRYFGETDELIQKRAHRALAAGIRPIVCIGETLEERESEQTYKVIERQVQVGLNNLTLKGIGGLVIAYEPVWAIGTGRTATPEQAQDAHRYIRSLLKSKFGDKAANETVIQYGGSVTDENAAELMSCPDVDGALVGGASLKPEKFIPIVEAANQ